MIKGCLLVLAVLSAAPLWAQKASHSSGDKPNFVIVLADDVSWTSFGCVGGGLYTRTPNIDRLAGQAIRFTNFSCSSAQCGPTRHELYTGLLPPTSGVFSNGSKPKEDYQSIANYLGDLGYMVGLTGKTHFNVSDFHQIAGFESNGNHSVPTWNLSAAQQFIETSRSDNKPFCLVVASVNAHHPWTIGDPSNFPLDQIVVPPHMVDTPLTRKALAAHAAEVEVLDDQVGATMQLLDDLKLADNTVLIFLSEQGTALPNGKWSIYDYGTRAVCLVRWPGRFEPAVTDAVAMYCDISSTLVEIAGGKAPATDGKSLLPVLKGETSDHREHAYLVHQAGGYTQRAIRNKDFKLVWNPEREVDYYLDVLMKPTSGKFFAKAWKEWLEKAQTDPLAQRKIDRVVKHPEFELYDIKNDPWELNNLAENPAYKQKVVEMRGQLQAEMEKLKDTFSTADPKDAKRARKEKAIRSQGNEPKEKRGLSEQTDKQRQRQARKQARQMSKEKTPARE